MQTASAKVPFISANATKCMCPQCPVQTKSQCVSTKMAGIKGALNKNPLNHEDIPGVYCSAGLATCQDINTKQSCICGTCAVFESYKLASGQPVGYYCRDGNAR